MALKVTLVHENFDVTELVNATVSFKDMERVDSETASVSRLVVEFKVSENMNAIKRLLSFHDVTSIAFYSNEKRMFGITLPYEQTEDGMSNLYESHVHYDDTYKVIIDGNKTEV